MPPSKQALNGSNIPTMAAMELTTSLSRHSFSWLPSASLPRDQKKFGPLTLQPLPPHSTSIGSAQQDSGADVRLRAHLHTSPATIIPAEDDDELLDAPPDIDVPVSTAVSSALTHLEQAIDDMHSASPTPLSFDPLFYLALSSLLLTYPWPILTIDLKNFGAGSEVPPSEAPFKGA